MLLYSLVIASVRRFLEQTNLTSTNKISFTSRIVEYPKMIIQYPLYLFPRVTQLCIKRLEPEILMLFINLRLEDVGWLILMYVPVG